MFQLFSRRNTPLVVAVHDGALWRARNFHFHHGQWHAEDVLEVPSRNQRKLPKQIIDFALAADARRVRILLSGELHTISMELPEDAESEEMHTALVYEAAGEMGVEAHMLRIAAVRAEHFRMGAEPNVILTCGFEARLIEGLIQECERAGLEFDGIGSLEMAVLSAHARQSEETRLLFLRRQSALYAVPAYDAVPFMLSALPFGYVPDDSETGRERASRAARRLETQRALPLRVISCESMALAQRQALLELIGAEPEPEMLALAEIEEAALSHVAWAEVGGTEAGCALVGPPPKPRDPHRAGTYVFFFILLATLVYGWSRWQTLNVEMRQAKEREKAWKILQTEREKAKTEFESTDRQLQGLRHREQLLRKRRILPEAAGSILETLAFQTPKYTRIAEIVQMPGEEFEIRGVTRWQEGLRLLAEALGQRGLARDFSSDMAEGNGEQRFTFKVRATGEGR